MDAANTAGNLRVFKEKEEVMWLSTPLKDQYESTMLSSANDQVIRYCYGKIDHDAYLSAVSEGQWPSVLAEINETLGYAK